MSDGVPVALAEWYGEQSPGILLRRCWADHQVMLMADFNRKCRAFAVACLNDRGAARDRHWQQLETGFAENADWFISDFDWAASWCDWDGSDPKGAGVAMKRRAAILRDIFGPGPSCAVVLTDNQLGPPTQAEFAAMPGGVYYQVFRRHWITPRVKEMCESFYESRDFEFMPAMADEMEERCGCDSGLVLRHCRGFDPCWKCHRWHPAGRPNCSLCHGEGWVQTGHGHVRGCWVADIILGKV